MSAPAALAIAKIIYPETEIPETGSEIKLEIEKVDANSMDALGRGATEGLKLAANVAAMLIAFVSIVSLINYLLGIAGTSLEEIFAFVFKPLAWAMGVPWKEAGMMGMLMGEKIAFTELIAYGDLKNMLATGQISERTAIIASYALCGFANFGSIGIQLGGIGGMAPNRRKDLAKLVVKAMVGGALASWLTATIAGILI
jgi:CNT family concentrative nucleoside transporter